MINKESMKPILSDQTEAHGDRDNFGETISKMSKTPKFQDPLFEIKDIPQTQASAAAESSR